MTRSEPNARLRRTVRGFYAWLGAVLFAVIAPLLAMRLIETEGITGRIIGVVLGVLLWLPMIAVVTLLIRRGDEFERRLHLIAIAIAFGATQLLINALDWLVRAHFMSPPPLSVLWLAIAVLWFMSIMMTKRYYARQQ